MNPSVNFLKPFDLDIPAGSDSLQAWATAHPDWEEAGSDWPYPLQIDLRGLGTRAMEGITVTCDGPLLMVNTQGRSEAEYDELPHTFRCDLVADEDATPEEEYPITRFCPLIINSALRKHRIVLVNEGETTVHVAGCDIGFARGANA